VSVLFYEIRRKYGLYSLFKASIRGFFGRREFERTLHAHRAVVNSIYVPLLNTISTITKKTNTFWMIL
jgi:hypothetical protein